MARLTADPMYAAGAFELGPHTTWDGEILTEYRWPVRRPAAHVVLFHGAGEHLGRYDHVARHLNRSRLSVTGIDLRGHGRSRADRDGPDSYQHLLDDHAEYVGRLVARRRLPVFAVAHSFGASLALTLAGEGRLPVRGLVTSGAAVTVSNLLAVNALRAVGLAQRLLPQIRVPGVAANVSSDPDVIRAYRDDPLVLHKIPLRLLTQVVALAGHCRTVLEGVDVPLLALHGSHDRLADVLTIDTVRSGVRSDDATYRVLDGWYHELFNEPDHEELLDDVVDWMMTRT